MKNYLFIVEGNHDISLLSKLLHKFFDFHEVKNKKELTEMFQKNLPNGYPFKKDRLSVFNFVPVFLATKEIQVCIKNAGSENNLLTELDDLIDRWKIEDLYQLEKIVIYADGDLNDKNQKINKLKSHVNENLNYITQDSFQESKVKIENYDLDIEIFIFPNNSSKGRIEDILLESLKVTYPDLLEKANLYLESVSDKYRNKWNEGNSKREKALIGCIGNVINSGASNTALISSNEFQWIDVESKYISVIRTYLDMILNNNHKSEWNEK